MKKRIAICDDQEIDRQVLRMALECLLLARGLEADITEYPSGERLLADVEGRHQTFDLYFLDIFLGELSGMDTARRLREMGIQASIVFQSGSSDYAAEGYEVSAVGYLLKPLDPQKLNSLLSRLLVERAQRRLAIHCGRETKYVQVDEITWMESRGNNVLAHLTDGTVLETREKLSVLEELVDDKRFLRCHQSYLVNMEQVTAVQNMFRMRDGTEIPIRVRDRKVLRERYQEWVLACCLNGSMSAKIAGG